MLAMTSNDSARVHSLDASNADVWTRARSPSLARGLKGEADDSDIDHGAMVGRVVEQTIDTKLAG
jgi:hypothetical protein